MNDKKRVSIALTEDEAFGLANVLTSTIDGVEDKQTVRTLERVLALAERCLDLFEKIRKGDLKK